MLAYIVRRDISVPTPTLVPWRARLDGTLGKARWHRDRHWTQERVRARDGAPAPEGQRGRRRRAPAHHRAEGRDRGGAACLRSQGGRAGDPPPRRTTTGEEPPGSPKAQRGAGQGLRSLRPRP